MARLQVTLSMAEVEALGRWANSELRDPRDQIRLLVRAELRRRGLLGDGAACPPAQGSGEPDQRGVGLEAGERE